MNIFQKYFQPQVFKERKMLLEIDYYKKKYIEKGIKTTKK